MINKSKIQSRQDCKANRYQGVSLCLRLLCLLTSSILLLSGCGASVNVAPNPQDRESGKDPMSEYGLFFEDTYYTVNEVCQIEIPDLKVEEFDAESGFFGGRNYTAEGLRIQTIYADKEKSSEKPVLMITTSEGRTLRGIGIGGSLSELQSVYQEELEYVYTFEYSPDQDPVKYDRVYAFASNKDSSDYLLFYLYEKTIVMIETGDSFGMAPGGAEWDNFLGYENVIKEMDNRYPEYIITRYYAVDENMQESPLFEFTGFFQPVSEEEYPWHLTETDLDEDGVFELVVELVTGNTFSNVGIYHLVDGQIDYLDVNETLGSVYCRYTTSSRLTSEYTDCFEVSFTGEAGGDENEDPVRYIYVYQDKQLVQAEPYSDAPDRK